MLMFNLEVLRDSFGSFLLVPDCELFQRVRLPDHLRSLPEGAWVRYYPDKPEKSYLQDAINPGQRSYWREPKKPSQPSQLCPACQAQLILNPSHDSAECANCDRDWTGLELLAYHDRQNKTDQVKWFGPFSCEKPGLQAKFVFDEAQHLPEVKPEPKYVRHYIQEPKKPEPKPEPKPELPWIDDYDLLADARRVAVGCEEPVKKNILEARAGVLTIEDMDRMDRERIHGGSKG